MGAGHVAGESGMLRVVAGGPGTLQEVSGAEVYCGWAGYVADGPRRVRVLRVIRRWAKGG